MPNFCAKFSKNVFLTDPDLEFWIRLVSRSWSVATLLHPTSSLPKRHQSNVFFLRASNISFRALRWHTLYLMHRSAWFVMLRFVTINKCVASRAWRHYEKWCRCGIVWAQRTSIVREKYKNTEQTEKIMTSIALSISRENKPDVPVLSFLHVDNIQPITVSTDACMVCMRLQKNFQRAQKHQPLK